MADKPTIPGTGGDIYLPYEQRTGGESIVYFTRELSAAGLRDAFSRVGARIGGRIAVKLHTGEKDGPNIIPPAWVKELIANDLPGATIVETNTYYPGTRATTEEHRETLAVNGWDFAPVDIVDEGGNTMLPVAGGKWFSEFSVGAGLLEYDSLVVLTHFKGHAMGGFGGSNKNLAVGCADAKIGKASLHSVPGSGDPWGIQQEELMERMVEASKSLIDHFGEQITFVNVMRNMSVSCDCEGTNAEPVATPNIGILASLDMAALDQACIDLVYALNPDDRQALVERIESRHGLRQLSYLKELGVGNDRYRLMDIDNGVVAISPAEAVAHVVPFTS